MRFFVGVTSAFGAGILLGMGLGAILLEDRTRKKYEESMRSHRRAIEMAREAPVPAEPKTDVFEVPQGKQLNLNEGPVEQFHAPANVVKTKGDTADFTPGTENPYHVAVDDPSDPRPTFIYLTEEDFEQDDGRAKNQIAILMDGQQPVFIENGGEIRDWEEKIGMHVLRDMYALCPPGERPVLYIRNVQRDEDYEVVVEQP